MDLETARWRTAPQTVCVVGGLWVSGAPFHLMTLVPMLLTGKETSYTHWLESVQAQGQIWFHRGKLETHLSTMYQHEVRDPLET